MFVIKISGSSRLLKESLVYLPPVDMLHGAQTTSPGLIELIQ